MKPETVTTLSEFLYMKLWPDGFTGRSWRHFVKKCLLSLQLLLAQLVDDHHTEDGVQEPEAPATKNQKSQLESQHTRKDVSKKDFELLKRHLQSIHSKCGHCSNETLVRALRRKGAKPLILRLAREPVCPSCQEILSQRPHPVASSEAILPKWQNIQIDQAEWIHPTGSLDTSFLFSVVKVLIWRWARCFFP